MKREGEVRIPSGCAIAAVISKEGTRMSGQTIVDADVSKFRGDEYNTPNHWKFPGLRNLHGRIGWCGHGYDIEWRNIRVKELPTSPLSIDEARWGFDAAGQAFWIGHGVAPNEKGWSVLWGGGSPVPVDAKEGPNGEVVLAKEYRYEGHPDW